MVNLSLKHSIRVIFVKSKDVMIVMLLAEIFVLNVEIKYSDFIECFCVLCFSREVVIHGVFYILLSMF